MKNRIRLLMIFFGAMLLPVTSHALCVSASTANLRSGPGLNYQIEWEVFQFMPFQRMKVSRSGWYQVKNLDGQVHWIHKSLVTSKYECAVVKSETANIRTGPGLTYPHKFTEPAMKYDSFRILKRKGDWVNVKDEFGDTGWIYRKLLWIN